VAQAVVVGAEACARPAASVEAASAGRYVVSRGYDWAFFLGAPALGVVVAAVVALTHAADRVFWVDGGRSSYVDVGLGVLIQAHLGAVLLRSHANTEILRRHPLRFLVVPPALVLAIVFFEPVAIVATVVAVFWDVYHSALQTFGFARLYDRRAGNAPDVGRRLDLGLNLVLYVGPIVAGASMLAHFGELEDLEQVGLGFFSAVPTFLDERKRWVALAVLALGATYVAWYVASYVRLARRGYSVSWPKVWLLGSTGLCSIVAWGFNPWGLAFFIMNFFHAVQYLGLVWWTEGDRLRRRSRVGALAPILFVGVLGAYGWWAQRSTPDMRWSWAIAQTIALMHFWYDGFIWSVSKRHIR